MRKRKGGMEREGRERKNKRAKDNEGSTSTTKDDILKKSEDVSTSFPWIRYSSPFQLLAKRHAVITAAGGGGGVRRMFAEDLVHEISQRRVSSNFPQDVVTQRRS